jgi:hypothetical protein
MTEVPAFEGFTISNAENRLSLRCAVVALQKCFVGFCTSRLVIVLFHNDSILNED